MKIILLCAGFATRLKPISYTTPKHLLKVDGEIVLDRFLRSLNIEREKILITNDKYYSQFLKTGLNVYSDGVLDKADRMGAIGDLIYIIDRLAIQEDILVCAPDHIAEGFDFKKMIGDTSSTGVMIENDIEKLKAGSCLKITDEFITRFEEKPQNPFSNLYGLPYYFIKRHDLKHLKNIRRLDNSGEIVKCLVQYSKIRGILSKVKSKHITTKEDL